MNRRLFAAALTASVLVWSGAVLSADSFGTPDEGKAMLERAVAALKVNEAAALKQFNDANSKQFRDRDLYIFCFTVSDGKFTAFQGPAMLGIDIRELKLPPNDPIGQRAYDVVAKAEDGSFVTIEYDFPKPGTKQPAVKESLETRVGNQACGVAYFK
jgi:hypothetical protein